MFCPLSLVPKRRGLKSRSYRENGYNVDTQYALSVDVENTAILLEASVDSRTAESPFRILRPALPADTQEWKYMRVLMT